MIKRLLAIGQQRRDIGESRPAGPMRKYRIASQWIFGLLFLVLFFNTRYMGEDVISWPVNAFFTVDPLAAITAMAAARKFLGFFWPVLILLPLTLLVGRAFCGWICPMGGLLDLFGRSSQDRSPKPEGRFYPVKDILLVILLLSSVFAVNIAGLFDPLSILIRSLAMGVVHPLERSIHALFDLAWKAGSPISAVTEPVYRFLTQHLLSFQLPAFRYTALFLLIFILIILLELKERRFWCRNLCPLGALLGRCSAASPLGLSIDKPPCTACGQCTPTCRMGAIIGEDRAKGVEVKQEIRKRDCILCYDCIGACDDKLISHRLTPIPDQHRTVPLLPMTRRGFMGAAGAGVLLPLAMGKAARPDGLPMDLIRPPGAVSEDRFLRLCLRCGECMRVCLTNGLQPTLFEAGVEAMWTPRLVSRLGYCEYSCTLCGQVCPTEAIVHLDTVTKRKVCIGTAIIDRNRCIPFVKPEQCMVCEEHCPTPEKAIVFDDVAVPVPDGPPGATPSGATIVVKQPRVIEELCIGCGICENKCPLDSKSAIVMVRDGEDREKDADSSPLPGVYGLQ
jgi:polyferredoxin/Pyruvate/2-oxoacid:ferredoxin oxidoreductase delta subunit